MTILTVLKSASPPLVTKNTVYFRQMRSEAALSSVGEDFGFASLKRAWEATQFRMRLLKGHNDIITCVGVSDNYPHGPLLFTGSWDGSVKVWECEGESARSIPLRHLRTCDIFGHLVSVRSLSARGEIVYVGTNRASIQVLQWKTGAISKLTNHSTESGVTDCVCQTRDGLLLSSGFDLDTGSSFLNLRSLPDDSYLATLCWPTASRILCVATWLTSSGGHRWITGGEELIVWEQLPANTKDKSDVTVTRMSSLDHKPVDTGSEGETELSNDEEDVEEEEVPWAIDWGPTQPPEDDTGDVPAHELRHRQQNQQLHHPHYRPHFHNTATPPQDDSLGPNERGRGGEREKSGGHGVVTLETELSEKETEAVDPQFYVTIIISTLLVLIAATITAKLCYDHRGKRRAPLSHSLTLSRTLISEESRQALTSAGAIPRTPSLEPQTPSPLEEKQAVEGSQLSALHRGRIPLVNL
ncbi:SCONB ligase, partial [Polypterus senegalus]